MNINKFIVFICIGILSCIAAFAREVTAEEIWVEGMTWKSVDFFFDNEVPVITNHWLGSPIEIDGRTYLTLNGNEDFLKVRAENNCLYLYSTDFIVEGGNGEILAYDFNDLADKMTMNADACTLKDGCDPAIIEQVVYQFDSRELARSYFNDSPEIWIYTKSESTRHLASGIGWLDDLFGMINEPVPGSLIDRAVGEIRNPQGELLYRHPKMEEWEKQIAHSAMVYAREESTMIYDLFGRVVHNPQTGCVYVQNGKKVIFGDGVK